MATAALGADLLIAEAKRRARKRRAIAVGAVLVVAAAVAGMLASRSSADSLGVCAAAASGFRERPVTGIALAPPTVVLTNFRFGRLHYVYGLGDPTVHWPVGGVMISVSNWGPATEWKGPVASALRVDRGDFGSFEGMRLPFAQIEVRAAGRHLEAWVEDRSVTPETIAAANAALAGVMVCST